MSNMNEIIPYVYSLSFNELGLPKRLLSILHKHGYYTTNDIKDLTVNELSNTLNAQINKVAYLLNIIFEKCIYVENLTNIFLILI